MTTINFVPDRQTTGGPLMDIHCEYVKETQRRMREILDRAYDDIDLRPDTEIYGIEAYYKAFKVRT